MVKKQNGITIIVLIVTIVILLIIAGVTLNSITQHDSVIEKAKTTSKNAERESMIEKIEADLYSEKTRTGKTPTKEKLKELIKEKEYGTQDKIEENYFTTKERTIRNKI